MLSTYQISAPHNSGVSPLRVGCLMLNSFLLKSIFTSPGRRPKNRGKWSDRGTVPYRVGVPDPNVLSLEIFGSKNGENIGAYSDSTWDGLKADLAIISCHRSFFDCLWGLRCEHHTYAGQFVMHQSR